jgi:spermidine/putrescine-binding protein
VSKRFVGAALMLVCLSAVPATAGVEVSCFRGPIPQSAVINGANKTFIQSIYQTYDVTMEEAKAIAESVCSDMSAVKYRERLLEIARVRLTGLPPR